MNRIQRISCLLFGFCFFLMLWTYIIYIRSENIYCTTPECWRYYESLKASMVEDDKMFLSPLTHVKGIMLGGVQRSGVNLLRTMLHAHPQLDCSHEISLDKWKDQDMNDQAVLHDITQAIGEKIPTEFSKTKNQLVCIKADFDYLQVLSRVLPNFKVIVMIRDGRAVAHSMVTRSKEIEDFDTALNFWSNSLSIMLDQCYALDSEMCMMMIYEKLVVDTEVWMKATLTFAGLPWNPDVLNHSNVTKDDYYEKLGTIHGRLKESVHSDAIGEWRLTLTEDELQRLFAMAPLLRKLGYPQ